MKKFLDKKIFLGLIIGLVLCSFITAFAITTYNSDGVLYKKGNSNVTVTSALDELYETCVDINEQNNASLALNLKTTVTANRYWSGVGTNTDLGNFSSIVNSNLFNSTTNMNNSTKQLELTGGNYAPGSYIDVTHEITSANISDLNIDQNVTGNLNIVLRTYILGSRVWSSVAYDANLGFYDTKYVINFQNGSITSSKVLENGTKRINLTGGNYAPGSYVTMYHSLTSILWG